MKTTVRIHPAFALVPSRRHVLCLAVLSMFMLTVLAGAAMPGITIREGIPDSCFGPAPTPSVILTKSGDIESLTTPVSQTSWYEYHLN